MPPSFERLDYLLRANKNIERKLVFDVLLRGQQMLAFPSPTYLGFGSIWFGDFRLAHRILGLKKMVSVERERYAERAEFNKPYDSITVRPGECAAVLRAFGNDDWAPPTFAWLDFDGRLTEDAVSAIDVFLECCSAHSVLIVTVNAQRKRYSPDRIRLRRDQTSVGFLEQTLGAGVVEPRFEPRRTAGGKYEDVGDDQFPVLLADSLLSYMFHRIRILARMSGNSPLTFVPLFNLCHEDGAAMVTVGGAVCASDDAEAWRRCLIDHPVLGSQDGLPMFRKLDLIPITLKEKLALDSCLPHLEAQFLVRAQTSGIGLTAEQIEKYRLLNRHFPVFVESPI